MKAQQLKNSILQLAVQGKLVSQDPNDEPASVLLERIRAEKQQLIKEGKIKKEKPLPPISEDEKPFDVLESWEWVRLGNVVEIKSSKRIFEHDYVNGGVPFYRSKEIGDLSRGEIIKSKFYITKEKFIDIKNRFGSPQKGDILVTSVGTIGNCWVSDGRDFCYKDGNVAQISSTDYILSEFILLYLKSPLFFLQALGTVAGTAYSALTIIKLSNVLFPLPPLAEQHRIVERIEQLLPHINEYEATEQKLTTLNDTFPDQLKKSILQAAVQGKLVPQDPNDEPTSTLLERIQAEKEQLIKEGKIKKEKPLPPINEDEKPFDVPEGWVWCRLGDVIELISGRDLETNQFNGEQRGIPYVTGASTIEGAEILINRWTDSPVVFSRTNDILLSCKGTVGKIVINSIGDCHIARQIMAIRVVFCEISNEYIKLFLHSYIVQLNIRAKSIIPGISRDDVLYALLPLPPLAEQRRIVERLEELLPIIERCRRL